MKKIVWAAGIAMMVAGVAQAALVYSADFSTDSSTNYVSSSNALLLGGATPDVSTNDWFGSSNGVGVGNGILSLANSVANRYRGAGVWLDTTGWETGLVTVQIEAANYTAGADTIFIFQAYAATGVNTTDSSVSLDLHGAVVTGSDPIASGSATIGTLGAQQTVTADGINTFTFGYNGTDQYVGLTFVQVNAASGTAFGSVDLDNLTVNTIPEPATLGLVAAFGGGILFIRRRLML